MAKRMTKKDFIKEIENTFRLHPDMEVVVKDLHFRNTRWGFHGYCLCWSNNTIMVRPWSGADTYWCTDLMKKTRAELAEIMERCWKSY